MIEVDLAQIERDILGEDDDLDLDFELPSFTTDDDDKKKGKRKSNLRRTSRGAKPRRKSKNRKSSSGSSRSPVRSSPTPERGSRSDRLRSKSSSSGRKKSTSRRKSRKKNVIEINLPKKSRKRLEVIYKEYEDDGMNIELFEDCVNSLNMIDNQKLHPDDVSNLFFEATDDADVADFEVFLTAISLVALKRYPDGINEDAAAAIERLLSSMPQETDKKALREKQLAVYQAKKRAAQRAKEMKKKNS